MTVTSSQSRVSYDGDGSTTAFPVPFYFLAAADLVVMRRAVNGTETTLALTTDYSVTGAGEQAGGQVSAVVAPAAGERLVIYRDPPVTQDADYIAGGRFPAESHERALDRQTMIAQRTRDMMDRSLRLAETEIDGSGTYNANGNRIKGLGEPVDDDEVATRSFVLSAPGSAAAEALAYRDEALAARDETIAVAGAVKVSFASRAAVQSENIPPVVGHIMTAGYAAAGDGGGGLYVRVGSQPPHAGKVQSGDGAWWELREDEPNVLQFGAVDNGTATDDTAAFNALAGYCNAFERPGYVPPAQVGFATNGGHTFDYGLVGAGEWRSLVYITHATNTIITSLSNNAGQFRGVWYLASVVRTGGYTILIDAPSGSVAYKAAIRENVFQGGYIDIGLKRANIASVEDNFSTDFRKHFLEIQNVNFPDNGDHSIEGNVWDTSHVSADAGVIQYNAGGCRILNNKAGRGAFGYELVMTGTGAPESTSILLIDGNSFENQTVGQIRLRRFDGATATFRHVAITDNEFAGSPAGNASIALDDGEDFITNIVVSGNVFQFTGTGISATSAKNIIIEGNVFESFGGSSVGITVGGSVEGFIGVNEFKDVTTPISNGSANVRVARWSQSGATTISTSGAYGPLYSGAAAITFPIAFSVAAEVTVQANGGGGFLSATIDGNPTATGFTARVFGVNNGSGINIRWQAWGY